MGRRQVRGKGNTLKGQAGKREVRFPKFVYLVELTMVFVVDQGESVDPRLLVEVHQHPLLQLVLAVVDGNGVVVPVEAVDKGLNGRLLEVTQH